MEPVIDGLPGDAATGADVELAVGDGTLLVLPGVTADADQST